MDLTSIFGTAITVTPHPRVSQKQRVGFPGAHGVIGIELGTRGRIILVSGQLRATGASFAVAYLAMLALISAIESYQSASSATYTYGSATFYNVDFGDFRLVKRGDRSFRWTPTGLICDFEQELIEAV